MTTALLRSLDRLERYVARARHSVELGDYALALAEVAEAHYIAKQLWKELAKANLEKEASQPDK
jgi:hypothetical protein